MFLQHHFMTYTLKWSVLYDYIGVMHPRLIICLANAFLLSSLLASSPSMVLQSTGLPWNSTDIFFCPADNYRYPWTSPQKVPNNKEWIQLQIFFGTQLAMLLKKPQELELRLPFILYLENQKYLWDPVFLS